MGTLLFFFLFLVACLVMNKYRPGGSANEHHMEEYLRAKEEFDKNP